MSTKETVKMINHLLKSVDAMLNQYVREDGQMQLQEANIGLCTILDFQTPNIKVEKKHEFFIQMIRRFQDTDYPACKERMTQKYWQNDICCSYWWHYNCERYTTEPAEWYKPRIVFLKKWKAELNGQK